MAGQETVFISEADQYLFAQGTHYDIYKNSQDCKKGGGVWCKYSKHCYCNIGLAG